MVAYTRDMVAELLAPLRGLPDGAAPSPAGRGLLYQLEQGLGSVLRARADPQVRHLTADDRRLLRRLGVTVGERVVFSAELLSPWAVERRAALWAARTGTRVPSPGAAVSTPIAAHGDVGLFYAIGYPPFGPRAIRADVAEQVFARLVAATRAGPAALPEEPGAWLDCAADELQEVAAAMGFVEVEDGLWMLAPRRPERSRSGRRGARVSRAG